MKVSNYLTKAANFFRLFFFLFSMQIPNILAQKIENPSSTPPSKTPEKLNSNQELINLKNRRQQREPDIEKTPEDPIENLEEKRAEEFEKKQKQTLKEQTLSSQKPRFFMQTGIAYTYASVSKGREKYVMDPSWNLNIGIRGNPDIDTEDHHFIYGMNMIALSGNGIYKSQPARFSFLYFGPMIGLASFSRYRLMESSSGLAAGEKGIGATKAGHGYMLLGGFQLQSRFVKLGEGEPPPDKEFNQKGIGFDAPGIWLQLQYLRMHYSTLHWGPNLGVVLGEGKSFFYLGILAGGWSH